MESYKKKLDKLRADNFLKRFEYELKDSEMFEFDSDRVDNLKKLIRVLKGEEKKDTKDVKYEDRSIKKNTSYANDIKDYFNSLDNLSYKKRWNSMRDFHKEEKLKEFVEQQALDSETKKMFIKDLLAAFNDKKLHTEKHISYNKDLMKIEQINGVDIDIKNSSYSILKKKR